MLYLEPTCFVVVGSFSSLSYGLKLKSVVFNDLGSPELLFLLLGGLGKACTAKGNSI